jgi:nitrate/nitrite transporter NarK
VAAAGAIALINAFGAVGGFLAPNLRVWAERAMAHSSAGVYALAGTTVVAAALFVLIRHRTLESTRPPQAAVD